MTVRPLFLASLMLAALAVPASATPKPAPAAAPRPAAQERSLELEITESASGKTGAPVRLQVPLVVDASTSEIRVRSGATFYHLIASGRRDRAGTLVVDVQLDVRDGSDKSPNDFDVKVSSVPTIGKRAVVVAAERPDGSRMEVAMIVR